MRLVISTFLFLLALISSGCDNNTPETSNMTGIDLKTFSINGVAIGDLAPANVQNLAGVEIELEGENLDSLFVTLDEYKGNFLSSGEAITVSTKTSPKTIEQLFGTPFWEDSSDGELIMFYEYRAGSIEIQFEFPDSSQLGYITMAKNGVLSDPDQRKSYGVEKPWPPSD